MFSTEPDRRWAISCHATDSPRDSEDILTQILVDRGFRSSDQQVDFLNPRLSHLCDPLRIPDMELAVQRVDQAISKSEKILLFCDYDVDGMTSGALMHRFLSSFTPHVNVFIPERFGEGYGLSEAGIQRALSMHKPNLLMALDCGTTSAESVEKLNQLGIDCVIIDHHVITSENLPKAVALVNPQRSNEDRYLATVGLVFKFCHAFLKVRNDPTLFDLRQNLDLVALGTVADLVPLIADNRILVKQGLQIMGRTQNLGLQELMKKAGVRNQPTPSVCGFALGPRLNASGRLAEAQKGCKLLMTQDRSEAKSIADELDRLNAQRQKLEQEVLEAAETMLSQVFDVQHDRCIVVGSRDWHQGVVGIVASRLQRRYHRPAIVISVDENGKGKGSCRTVDGCSLMSALEGCRQHLIQYGGHVMAAGLEIQEQNIEQFRVSLNQWLAENITDDCFAEHVHIDMELRGDELSEELCEKLALLEPFGKSNPSPIFAVCNVDIISPMRVISGKHLSFRARANQVNFDVIGFGCAHRRFTETRVDLAGHWELDDYTGEPCLRMVDWRSAVE